MNHILSTFTPESIEEKYRTTFGAHGNQLTFDNKAEITKIALAVFKDLYKLSGEELAQGLKAQHELIASYRYAADHTEDVNVMIGCAQRAILCGHQWGAGRLHRFYKQINPDLAKLYTNIERKIRKESDEQIKEVRNLRRDFKKVAIINTNTPGKKPYPSISEYDIQHASLAAREPAALFARDPAAPIANDPVAPIANEPVAPIANEPVAPIANEPAAPIANEPAAPAVVRPQPIPSSSHFQIDEVNELDVARIPSGFDYPPAVIESVQRSTLKAVRWIAMAFAKKGNMEQANLYKKIEREMRLALQSAEPAQSSFQPALSRHREQAERTQIRFPLSNISPSPLPVAHLGDRSSGIKRKAPASQEDENHYSQKRLDSTFRIEKPVVADIAAAEKPESIAVQGLLHLLR